MFLKTNQLLHKICFFSWFPVKRCTNNERDNKWDLTLANCILFKFMISKVDDFSYQLE